VEALIKMTGRGVKKASRYSLGRAVLLHNSRPVDGGLAGWRHGVSRKFASKALKNDRYQSLTFARKSASYAARLIRHVATTASARVSRSHHLIAAVTFVK